MQLISYPARPVNGGPLEKARRKFGGAWFYEPKGNGWRAALHLPSGEMWNRHGERLTIAGQFAEPADHCRRALAGTRIDWLDVETLERRHAVLPGTLIVLDAIVPDADYLMRRAVLAEHLWPFEPEKLHGSGHAALVQSYPAEQALELYGDLQKQNDRLTPKWRIDKLNCFWEGVVAKQAASHYPIQLRSSTQDFPFWMKHRFV